MMNKYRIKQFKNYAGYIRFLPQKRIIFWWIDGEAEYSNYAGALNQIRAWTGLNNTKVLDYRYPSNKELYESQ